MVKILIKNMVCRHCMEAVLGVFKELDLEVTEIKLGQATVKASQEAIDYERLRLGLEKNGFELLEDRE